MEPFGFNTWVAAFLLAWVELSLLRPGIITRGQYFGLWALGTVVLVRLDQKKQRRKAVPTVDENHAQPLGNSSQEKTLAPEQEKTNDGVEEPDEVNGGVEEPKEDPLTGWKRPPRDDCPICLITLPLGDEEKCYFNCCGHWICSGCTCQRTRIYVKDQVKKRRGRGPIRPEELEKVKNECPLCRDQWGICSRRKNGAEKVERERKLAEAGRPEAMCNLGVYYLEGKHIPQDKEVGLSWLRRGLQAGSARATYILGIFHMQGNGVCWDGNLALEYFQKAADIGMVTSYVTVGDFLMLHKEEKEALLNYRKAAMCGVNDKHAFDALRAGFKKGLITKAEYTFTLRESQNAIDEMKSDSRDKYVKWAAERCSKQLNEYEEVRLEDSVAKLLRRPARVQ